jgi:outer membrane protein assembly factor BamB
MKRLQFSTKLAVVLGLWGTLSVAVAQPDDYEQKARQILDATGVKGGLIVHLGCGDGKLTVALRANDSYLVHGLDADAAKVAAARAYASSLGLYGRVSFETWSGKRLPYVDNLVNLLVAEDLGGVSMAEVLRVLAPEGVAYVKSNGQWKKTIKPRPAQIDEWTHFLHGPDNNAVANDTEIDFPKYLQWIGDPDHSRSHQFLTSISTMVSSGGRLFYIVDKGSEWLQDYLPAKWTLYARDAFNGVVLWSRDISSWQPANQKGRIPFAPDLFRRLVAIGDRVYVTLSIFGPVSVLNAATGETIRIYANTEKTEELILDNGVLYCVIPLDDPASINRRMMVLQRTGPVKKRLIAIRAETGEMLWSKEDADTASYLPLTLIAQGNRTLFQNAEAICCLDSGTGKVLWRHDQASLYAREAWSTPTLVIADDVVLSADRLTGGKRARAATNTGADAQLVALSAATGKVLWQCSCAEGHTSSPEVFVVNGVVWAGTSPRHRQLDWRTGRDLHTGKVVKDFGETEGWPDWHHHRCYREKATTRFLLSSRTGVEFTDLESGKLTPHNWIRGVCRYGILPCNGMIYLPPDQCACYIQSRLTGFNAVTAKRQSDAEEKLTDDQRLFRGPAYGQVGSVAVKPSASDDWPTLRHDASRSGSTPAQIGPDLKRQWSVSLGGDLTSLVSAGHKLYVGQANTHSVICLDAESGAVLWKFVANGRVDSPPTLAKGLAVFGSLDGYVYALRATDGQLVWRFLAAPSNRLLVSHDQLESVWPVHGSTLVEDDKVYVAAGRNSYFDGGISLYQLDLMTGKPLLTKRYYSRDSATGQRYDLYPPYLGEVLPDREMPGLLPDVFASDTNALYLRSVALTRDLKLLGEGKPHLFCSMGFLDENSWERTYWMYGTHMYGGARGWGYAETITPAGKIMAFDDERVYAFDDVSSRMGLSLFAALKPTGRTSNPTVGKSVMNRRRARAGKKAMATKSSRKGDKSSRGIASYASEWRKNVPINVRAMLLSGSTLFVAGPQRFNEQAALAALASARTDDTKYPPILADTQASLEGKKGALLCAIDKRDGKQIGTLKLDSAPVFDGLIAAGGKLYMSALDGKVICMGSGQVLP